ncbi:MAG: protoheme IX farnesyltransferase [Nitrospirae bacterium]|nr:protoheme IX farnesyltransferase [Nitrospirota bacterium]
MILQQKYVIKTYLELCRLKLSSFSALSAVTGFMLAAPGLTAKMLHMSAGVYLLACGSSALNQFQERQTDALMQRTKHRPIPSGRIKPLNALFFSFGLLLTGSAELALTDNPYGLLLGLFAVILYNCVYTYLKRRTAFASVPCAVIGALPPAIGWTEGGGQFADPRLWAACFLFYTWQITHFWLLFLSNGSDYEKAGFPSVTSLFADRQLERIVFIWILATASMCLMTPLYGLVKLNAVSILLIAVTLWLIGNGVKLLRRTGRDLSYGSAFNRLNAYILFIMFLFSADKLCSFLFIRE